MSRAVDLPFGIRVRHGAGDFVSWAGYGFDSCYAFPTVRAARQFIAGHWTQLGQAWKGRNLRVARFDGASA